MDARYSRWMNGLRHGQLPARESWRAAGKRIIRARTSPEIRQRFRDLHPSAVTTNAKAGLRSQLGGSSWRGRVQAGMVLSRCPSLLNEYQRLGRLGERTERELEFKAESCSELLRGLRADRVRLWRELARIEALRGNSLINVTYRLRAMRLAGGDPYGDLPDVLAVLEQHGYAREAATADALFGLHSKRDERQRQLLQGAYETHRHCLEQPYEFVDDRRASREVKASVIVSLYHAADKLPKFLRAMSLQTLFAAGKAELILIDSGSPAGEYAVFRRMADELLLPVVYARSAARETIQSAWNRGIRLSRGEYLSFLGVDEGVRPQALERLARELDADPALDWVQADSLMTSVNAQGQWLADVLSYDRSGYRQSLVYLDTCYLSWVGAMYRRSIHDRCGYYDASFGAAGDTEFKCRVLPHIKTKVIPEMFGVFWNYPSGQTTCSPRAEIEDLRAWHLHRTLAGVRYAFQRRPLAEVEELLYAALGYRKSYSRRLSTDVEYACNLAAHLKQRTTAPEAGEQLRRIYSLLGAYRSLDLLPQASAQALARSLWRACYLAEKTARQHYGRGRERIRPACQVFNDNRYEQHIHIWAKAA
jgi:glycosyltransferase involved in cell wall biosynthesis